MRCKCTQYYLALNQALHSMALLVRIYAPAAVHLQLTCLRCLDVDVAVPVLFLQQCPSESCDRLLQEIPFAPNILSE